jgi:hypothetical protein
MPGPELGWSGISSLPLKSQEMSESMLSARSSGCDKFLELNRANDYLGSDVFSSSLTAQVAQARIVRKMQT